MGFPRLCSPHDTLVSEPAITFCTDQTCQSAKVAAIQPRRESSRGSQGTRRRHKKLLAKLCLSMELPEGLHSHRAPVLDALHPLLEAELPSLLSQSTTSLLREI